MARIIQDIDRCKLGMCRTNEGSIKQRWRNVLLTGTYMCPVPGDPIDIDGARYEVDEKSGLLLLDMGMGPSPQATAETLVRSSPDYRVVIFSIKPRDCYAREIAHEALHSVFRNHSHEHITGADGLEKCVTCGGMSL